jgi:hypothetical protein
MLRLNFLVGSNDEWFPRLVSNADVTFWPLTSKGQRNRCLQREPSQSGTDLSSASGAVTHGKIN